MLIVINVALTFVSFHAVIGLLVTMVVVTICIIYCYKKIDAHLNSLNMAHL